MLGLRNSFGLLIRSHSLSYYIYLYVCIYKYVCISLDSSRICN